MQELSFPHYSQFDNLDELILNEEEFREQYFSYLKAYEKFNIQKVKLLEELSNVEGSITNIQLLMHNILSEMIEQHYS